MILLSKQMGASTELFGHGAAIRAIILLVGFGFDLQSRKLRYNMLHRIITTFLPEFILLTRM
jgi:hypothetical protein